MVQTSPSQNPTEALLGEPVFHPCTLFLPSNDDDKISTCLDSTFKWRSCACHVTIDETNISTTNASMDVDKDTGAAPGAPNDKDSVPNSASEKNIILGFYSTPEKEASKYNWSLFEKMRRVIVTSGVGVLALSGEGLRVLTSLLKTRQKEGDENNDNKPEERSATNAAEAETITREIIKSNVLQLITDEEFRKVIEQVRQVVSEDDDVRRMLWSIWGIELIRR
ncbi:hypothetical protein TrST_g6912 [Triparma strigata]|uniref:Uncharacterized protein n=1 Tax=Triparma strigata TaxID=1606541 RepID=A0A9W7BHH5_9STRA|nr:hypothetical protein TrST_g6912 [Triparma strigata]